MLYSQHYFIKCDRPDLAHPGQFVHNDNDSKVAIGFIKSVKNGMIEIVLFEKIDISHIPFVTADTDDVDWPAALKVALEDTDVTITNMWQQLAQSIQTDGHKLSDVNNIVIHPKNTNPED